jgi:hypothetical protein
MGQEAKISSAAVLMADAGRARRESDGPQLVGAV